MCTRPSAHSIRHLTVRASGSCSSSATSSQVDLPGVGTRTLVSTAARTRGRRRQRLGLLDIGRIVGAVAVGDGVLAGSGQHLEFAGQRAADRAGVGIDRAELESHAREDARIGVVHDLVRTQHAGFIDVERIRVLHDELARAHHAEAWPDLVAELGLDLVEVDRQLLVAADLAAHDVGDHFLVRRPDDEVALLPILQTQHERPHLFQAAAFLPQLGGLDHRHHELQRAGAIHFLADDLLRPCAA